jgi:chaperone required for assembly of F1-ATPase
VVQRYKEPVERPKRFYKLVEVAEAEDRFAVRLDGREVRTPAGTPLRLPTRALAELIAGEWDAQDEFVLIAEMHATRLANTAVDSVPAAREATAQAVADYGGSDLTCYFAEGPEGLVGRQHAGWDPAVERVEREFSCAFVRAFGIVHQAQPAQTLSRLKDEALAMDDFRLAGVAFAASLFGSAVLAFSLARGWLTGEQAFELSRLDEAWQEEQWGVDAEAAERTARLADEARMLERWIRALD